MGVIVNFEGVRSGISDSMCMVLEDIYDLSKVTPNFVKYKNDNSYVIFTRNPQPPPLDDKGKMYYPGMTFAVNPATGQISALGGLGDCLPVIYIYRKIRSSDNNGTGPVCNIYNENHELFYTSRKTPLQIEAINKLDRDRIMNPFDKYVVRTNAHKLIVYSGIIASYAYSFYRELNIASVWGNGHLAIGETPYVGGDGSAASIYTDFAITAYAPDL